jgi:transformation/transcription domain-associated protein
LCEEIVNLLKTSFPLLSLTMEKMVDQITIRAKPASDEDIYRFFAALLTDSITQQFARGVLTDDVEVQAGTKDNMAKFSNNLPPELKAAVERDFIREPPPLRVYVQRLMKWRDSYESGLDARPRTQLLDQGGCNLIDFHLTKFEDVEIPGQYVHVSHHQHRPRMG